MFHESGPAHGVLGGPCAPSLPAEEATPLASCTDLTTSGATTNRNGRGRRGVDCPIENLLSHTLGFEAWANLHEVSDRAGEAIKLGDNKDRGSSRRDIAA